MKQFENQASCEEIDKKNTELRLNFQDSEIELTELKGQIATLQEAREILAADTARMGRFVSEAEDELGRLRELNDAYRPKRRSTSALNEENRALLRSQAESEQNYKREKMLFLLSKQI